MSGKEQNINKQFARVGKITSGTNKNCYTRKVISGSQKEISLKSLLVADN